MANDKLKSLFKAWGEVKEKIQDCLDDKNIAEQKEKVMNFVDKAREELNVVVEKDLAPLIKEGKKEFGKLQLRLEEMVSEKKKAPTKKKAAAKKTATKKSAKKK